MEDLKTERSRSLPGAIGMFGLSIGISHLGDTLPHPVYALLSGVNASTIGVTVFAAVKLSEKAVTDRLTRILLFLSASAGLLYTALWYLPVIVVLAGIVAIIYDCRWFHGPVEWVVTFMKRRRGVRTHDNVESQSGTVSSLATRGDDQATLNQDGEQSSDITVTNSQVGLPDSEQDSETSSSKRDKPQVARIEHRSEMS